jgi:hypothetical protein
MLIGKYVFEKVKEFVNKREFIYYPLPNVQATYGDGLECLKVDILDFETVGQMEQFAKTIKRPEQEISFRKT